MSAKPITNSAPSAEELQAAVELLERVVRDRALLAAMPEEDRTRLVQAAGEVFCPDLKERRRLVKAKTRQRKNEQIARDQGALNDTGIRKLRKEKIFTTPSAFPPLDFKQVEVEGDAEFREVVKPQNCYICKRDYSAIHHFYDQLCPACAELNFRKRTETADLRGRVALQIGRASCRERV